MPELNGYVFAKFLIWALFVHAGYRLWVSVRFGKHLRMMGTEGKPYTPQMHQYFLDSHTSNRYCYLANVLIAGMAVVFMRETSDTPRAGSLFVVHSIFLASWMVSLLGAYLANGIKAPHIHKYFGYTHVVSYGLILVTGSIMLWRL
jgi:FtsH-binding integral membrane protein